MSLARVHAVPHAAAAAWPALGFGRRTDAAPAPGLLGRRLHMPIEGTAEAEPALLWPPGGTVVEDWFSSHPVQHHQAGAVHWRSDGHWLYASAIVDERTLPGGLQAATAQAYGELFALLQRSGCPHLLRVWNYMADINGASDGLERYRHFNIGRQEAFLAARHSAFEGAPAACALGTRGGPLSVHVLAGTTPARPVENPRQLSAYHYPADYGPRSPSFSRAALADLGGGREALFISGTASIVGHASVHVGDVRRQTAETLDNIAAVLRAAAALSRARPLQLGDPGLQLTVYLRHAGDLPAVRTLVEARAGQAIYLHADICRAELLVEIEAHSLVAIENPEQ